MKSTSDRHHISNLIRFVNTGDFNNNSKPILSILSMSDVYYVLLAGRVGVKVASKKIHQAVGKADRRHQVQDY